MRKYGLVHVCLYAAFFTGVFNLHDLGVSVPTWVPNMHEMHGCGPLHLWVTQSASLGINVPVGGVNVNGLGSPLGVLHCLARVKNSLWACQCLSVSTFFIAALNLHDWMFLLQGYSTCITRGHCSYEDLQSTSLGGGGSISGGVIKVHVWGSLFLWEYLTCMDWGQCSCGGFNMHYLGWHQCKNELIHNNDLWLHQENNDICDMVWWTPLEYKCPPNSTPFKCCQNYVHYLS
jgi:hypothetical protein